MVVIPPVLLCAAGFLPGADSSPNGADLGIEALEGRVVRATITVMSLGDSGPGTLRAAITQADLDTNPETITFEPSVTGTITLLSALPDLSAVILRRILRNR
jgi:hypothetical protein